MLQLFSITLMMVAVGCGPRSENDLKDPLLQLTRYAASTPCSSEIVIDGDNQVWAEHGCEGSSSGWNTVSRVDAAQRAQLESLFDGAAATATMPDCRTYLASRGKNFSGGWWQACSDSTHTLTGEEQAFIDAMSLLDVR